MLIADQGICRSLTGCRYVMSNGNRGMLNLHLGASDDEPRGEGSYIHVIRGNLI